MPHPPDRFLALPALARPDPPISQRNLVVASGVVILHIGVLWVLQSGLMRRTVQVVEPVLMISQIITPAPPSPPTPPAPAPPPPAPPPPAPPPPPPAPPAPRVAPKPAPAVVRPRPQPRPVPQVRPLPPAPAPAPAPVAIAAPVPSPPPVQAAAAPQPPAPAPAPPAPAAPPTPPAPPLLSAPAPLELPSTRADYLRNPPPAYPPISKRLGEQGKVLVRVLIGADGIARQAEINQSSGFDRLDRAALKTVLQWRYVPGKRGGVAETMWFNVPINFVLE